MSQGPLDGIRVLEVTIYLFTSSTGAVLADWGADVLKVENAAFGDPCRYTAAWGISSDVDGLNYLWELSNRGKKSVGVDISAPGGREILLKLAEQSDVFLTNFLPGARKRLGIDVDDVRAKNPEIIYARGSAVGPLGPEAHNGGFDGVTYWARSGAAASAPRDLDGWVPAMPGPGFGDMQAGMALAGGIAAALLQRERTGNGAVVDTSLLSAGLWAMQPGIAGTSLVHTAELDPQRHYSSSNPLTTMYRTRDDRFIMLGLLQGDRYWPEFCVAVDRTDWLADERFANSESRDDNKLACIEMLDQLFSTRTLADWQDVFADQEFQWDVVRFPGEVLEDPQVRANGYVQTVTHPCGTSIRLTASPTQFDEVVVPLKSAPLHGENTDEVLKAAGIQPSRIDLLRTDGVIAKRP